MASDNGENTKGSPVDSGTLPGHGSSGSNHNGDTLASDNSGGNAGGKILPGRPYLQSGEKDPEAGIKGSGGIVSRYSAGGVRKPYNPNRASRDESPAGRPPRSKVPTVRERAQPLPTARDPETVLMAQGPENSKPDGKEAKLPDAAPQAMPRPASDQSPKDEMLNTVYLGKYELVSILGAGGMGVIYKAKQVFLERTMAIKMLKNKFASPKAHMRFHQEAKAASALNHPGIVAINDFGIDDQERPYMIMEYVEGATLSDILKQRVTLTVSECLPIFIEILDALAVAHKKGVIHRDIKPSNIMLAMNADGSVHVKLLDFGIAKMLDLEDRTIQDLTRTGEALGTPLYMSPEQIQSLKVDSRSDLYSFGCVMYMCLTGAPPFIGENKMATMDKHLLEAPISLKEASLGLDFPDELEDIIMTLLAKHPEDRIQSAAALRHALIHLAQELDIITLPEGLKVTSDTALSEIGFSPDIPQSVSQMVPVPTELEMSLASYGQMKTSTDFGRPGGQLGTTNFDNTGFGGTGSRQALNHSTAHDLQSKTGSQSRTGAQGARRASSQSNTQTGTDTGNFRTGGSSRLTSTGSFSARRPFEPGDAEPELKEPPAAASVLATAVIIGVSGFAFLLLCVLTAQFIARNASPKSTANAQIVTTPAPVVQKSILPEDQYMQQDDKGLAAKLSVNPHGAYIIFKNWMITDKGAPHLAKLKECVTLSLNSTMITDVGLKHLENLHLSMLSLENTTVTDAGMESLVKIGSLSNLILKDVKGITDKGVKTLTALKNLQSLNLEGTSVNSACAAALASMHSLRGVSLGATAFDDAGLAVLAASKHIFMLDLSHCPKVTDNGVKGLAQMKGLSALFLDGTAISDAAMAAVKDFKSLVWLDISNTGVTDHGLLELAKKTNLERLYIENLDLSSEAIEALKAKNPHCVIERRAHTRIGPI